MQLLKVSFDNVKMFKDGRFELDFFASDRVVSGEESVHEIKKSLYANNVLALSGINASGKTISLSLLRFVLNILEGKSLDSAIEEKEGFAGIFDWPVHMNVLFCGNGLFYILSSTLETASSNISPFSSEGRVNFADETIYHLPKSAVNKALLKKDFSEIISVASAIATRSELPESEKRFLSGGQSLILSLGLTERPGLALFNSDYPFAYVEGVSSALGIVLQAFDPGIEDVEAFDEGRAYRLTFANSKDPIITNADGLEKILSSGTLKGLGVVQFALVTLKLGGYLLLDEIENYLNHRLVKLIIDLFLSADTNPRGATLVFTTHYPEVLDHLHRKDCVYFLPRVGKGKTELVRYSSRVKRIENKKSEVFASNYVKGTAPSYREMNVLKEFVRQNV